MMETGDVDHLWTIAVDLFTACLFGFVFCFFIGLCCSYVVVQLIRDTWVNFLAKRFPDLDFDRSESLKCVLDSPRNVGVLVSLLTIRGRCDFDVIRHRLWTDVVDKRGPDGRLAFRRLRMVLTSRWGCYAWSNAQFSLNSHITLASCVYRGRPVGEHNIQEMVNEIVTKYLVAGIPPWHLTVIPTTTADRYYLLLRVHHLLFSVESGMRLCDFLTMIHGKRGYGPSVAFHMSRTHPFRDLYKQPKSLPILWDQVSQSFSNQWNEFLATYDPLENPSVLKSPGLKNIVGIAVIAFIAYLKNAVKRSRNSKYYQHRELSVKILITALQNSLNPLSLASRCLHHVYWAVKFTSIKLPLFVICECWSLCMINDEQYAERSFIKKISNGWKSIKSSLKEIFYFCRLAYNGPRILVEDLWINKSTTPHYLQSVSHAGRKVISWSQPVPLEVFQAVEEATGATRCDVLLTAVAAALRDFFLLHDNSAPDVVLAVAQAISQDELLKTAETGQGILCLALPTNHAWDITDGPIAELHTMQQVILRSRIRQPALYLASKLQTDYQFFTKSLPWNFTRLIMNWLTRSITVSITDIYQPPTIHKKHPIYPEVENLLYWTPTQANIGVSITLISHADEVIMCVMGDSQLAPHHAIISSTFHGHVRRLAAAAGVLTPTFPQNIPSDDSDDQSEPNSLTTTSSQYSVDYDTPDP